MIKQIEIKEGNGFTENKLYELTNNNIFICSDTKVKRRISEKLKEIWEKHDDGNDDVVYMYEPFSKEPIEAINGLNIESVKTTITELDDGQKFIFTIESPFILTAKDKKDIWFVDEDVDGDIYCYAFTEFKGHQKTWNKGVEALYIEFLLGGYGCVLTHRK